MHEIKSRLCVCFGLPKSYNLQLHLQFTNVSAQIMISNEILGLIVEK